MSNLSATKSLLRTSAQEFRDLCAQTKRTELAADLDTLLDRMDRGIFRLVVMGEIKKGKSSFINALLGLEDLLPTDSDIATSTVYKIVYGPQKKIKVFFLRDMETGREPEPLVIPEAQVAEYGTEAGNPRNAKGVDFIAIEHPSELLKTGLTIVDTPGVGGLYKAHRGITWKYAPNADAVFFVLDSVETVLSEGEVKFLRELTGQITDRVYFIQTKKDAVGTEQWQAWVERNRKLLLENLPKLTLEKLHYFPVSSKLKKRGEERKNPQLIADSGFPAVENFLTNELIARKDMILCGVTASMIAGKVQVLQKEQEVRHQMFQADSKERILEMERKIQTRKADFSDWRRTVFPEAQKAFSRRFDDIKRTTCDQLGELLDPSSPELAKVMDDLRADSSVTAQNLDADIAGIQQQVIANCSADGKHILEIFSAEVAREITEACRKIGAQVDSSQFVSRIGSLGDGKWQERVHVSGSLNLSGTGFDSLRNMGMGATFALGIVSFLTGGLGLLAFAAAGVGGYLAHNSQASKQKDEALAKTERILKELLAAMRKNVLGDFNRTATESDRAIQDLFAAAVLSTEEQYDRELRDIAQVKTQTAEEVKKDGDACTATVRRLVQLSADLGGISNGVDKA